MVAQDIFLLVRSSTLPTTTVCTYTQTLGTAAVFNPFKEIIQGKVLYVVSLRDISQGKALYIVRLRILYG